MQDGAECIMECLKQPQGGALAQPCSVCHVSYSHHHSGLGLGNFPGISSQQHLQRTQCNEWCGGSVYGFNS